MGGRARHGRKLGSAALSGSELGSILTIETVADVMGLLRRAVADTLMLERSLGRARTVGYLAGIMLKALEVGELEERIAALEAQLNRGRINGVYQNQN